MLLRRMVGQFNGIILQLWWPKLTISFTDGKTYPVVDNDSTFNLRRLLNHLSVHLPPLLSFINSQTASEHKTQTISPKETTPRNGPKVLPNKPRISKPRNPHSPSSPPIFPRRNLNFLIPPPRPPTRAPHPNLQPPLPQQLNMLRPHLQSLLQNPQTAPRHRPTSRRLRQQPSDLRDTTW